MPSGETHILANAGVLALGAGASHLLGYPPMHAPAAALLLGFAFGTFWVTPDLDMLGVMTAPRRAWGPLGVIWLPLLRVSKHRGASHTYLRGPVIRAAYLIFALGGVIGVVSALLGTSGVNLPALPDLPLHQVALAYLGYHLAQVAHLVLDRIPLTWKRL